MGAFSVLLHLGTKYINLAFLQNYLTNHLFHFFKSASFIVEKSGFNLRIGKHTFNMVKDCTGWKGILFLTALILSTSESLKKKINGLMINLPVIFSINLSRIVVLILLIQRFGPEAYPIFHDVLWQASMIIAVLAIWVTWLRNKNYSLAPLTVDKKVS